MESRSERAPSKTRAREAARPGSSPDAAAEAVAWSLDGSVAVDFRIECAAGPVRQVVLNVRFPEETRSTLEHVFWPRGKSIPETLAEVGGMYLISLLVPDETSPTGEKLARLAGSLHRPVVQMPLAAFREILGEVLASPDPGRAAPGH